MAEKPSCSVDASSSLLLVSRRCWSKLSSRSAFRYSVSMVVVSMLSRPVSALAVVAAAAGLVLLVVGLLLGAVSVFAGGVGGAAFVLAVVTVTVSVLAVVVGFGLCAAVAAGGAVICVCGYN